MHASPADFRAVRRDGVVLHFALLDEIAYVLADVPASGSAGTFIEAPCEEPHWGFVIRGDVTVVANGEETAVAPGSAFHVPAGLSHRIVVPGRARVAGFGRVGPEAPATDDALVAAGYEVVPAAAARSRTASVAVVRALPGLPPETGEVIARADRMGDLVFTRARFGRRSGYTSEPCDVPHWGLVVDGSVVIEWEDDVEVVAAGEVFYCAPGPPAHRIQAAEPATIVDFTPLEALGTAERVVDWRRGLVSGLPHHAAGALRIDVVALS